MIIISNHILLSYYHMYSGSLETCINVTHDFIKRGMQFHKMTVLSFLQ